MSRLWSGLGPGWMAGPRAGRSVAQNLVGGQFLEVYPRGHYWVQSCSITYLARDFLESASLDIIKTQLHIVLNSAPRWQHEKKGWARWLPEVSSNLNHSVILWYRTHVQEHQTNPTSAHRHTWSMVLQKYLFQSKSEICNRMPCFQTLLTHSYSAITHHILSSPDSL